MTDDGRTLPAIEEMTESDFAIAKERMIKLLEGCEQLTAAQYNEVFALMEAQGVRR